MPLQEAAAIVAGEAQPDPDDENRMAVACYARAMDHGGTMAVGTTQRPEGPKSKGSVIFTEGKTFVDIEFESAAGDPLPPDFVLDVARKQDAAIKAGLPG